MQKNIENIKENYDEIAKKLLLGKRCFCCMFGPIIENCSCTGLMISWDEIQIFKNKIRKNESLCSFFILHGDILSQKELEKFLKLRAYINEKKNN